jgi:hypothetical protein
MRHVRLGVVAVAGTEVDGPVPQGQADLSRDDVAGLLVGMRVDWKLAPLLKDEFAGHHLGPMHECPPDNPRQRLHGAAVIMVENHGADLPARPGKGQMDAELRTYDCLAGPMERLGACRSRRGLAGVGLISFQLEILPYQSGDQRTLLESAVAAEALETREFFRRKKNRDLPRRFWRRLGHRRVVSVLLTNCA